MRDGRKKKKYFRLERKQWVHMGRRGNKGVGREGVFGYSRSVYVTHLRGLAEEPLGQGPGWRESHEAKMNNKKGDASIL